MSMRSFLYAAEALMREEGLSFHVKTDDRHVPSPADAKQQNAQAMSAFQAMMGGVQKRGRRR